MQGDAGACTRVVGAAAQPQAPPPPASPHLQPHLLQLRTEGLHLPLQGLHLEVPGDRGQAGRVFGGPCTGAGGLTSSRLGSGRRELPSPTPVAPSPPHGSSRPQHPPPGQAAPHPAVTPAITGHPSRCRWGVRTSDRRGQPPPATAKHSDPQPPGQGEEGSRGRYSHPQAPVQEGWATHRRLPSGGGRADLNEGLRLLVLGGLLRDHHHRLDVLRQRRGPQEVGGALPGPQVGAAQHPLCTLHPGAFPRHPQAPGAAAAGGPLGLVPRAAGGSG